MKEFDLELAKAGHPVETRHGRKARIICFNREMENYPIVALVLKDDGVEEIYSYTSSGKIIDKGENSVDLIMTSEKHEGWVNVYRDADTGLPYCGKFVYLSEADAVTHNDPDDTSDKKVSVTKITWEE